MALSAEVAELNDVKIYKKSHEVQEGSSGHQDRKEVRQTGWRSQGHARHAQTPHDCNADVELKENGVMWGWGGGASHQEYILLRHLDACQVVTNMGWTFWMCHFYDKHSARWWNQ